MFSLRRISTQITSKGTLLAVRPNLVLRGYATAQDVSTLLLVEHKDKAISSSTLNALTAASKLSDNVTALVAGEDPEHVASEVSKIKGVSKVLIAKDKVYEHGLAEVYAPLLASTQKQLKFTHLVASHSAFGKNIMPRVAALLDVAQVSDVIDIESPDTFVRPIYAGNAIAKVKSKDPIKVLTIRGTAFPPAPAGETGASSEAAPESEKPALTEWVSEELQKSDRPELGTAAKIVSGGRALKSRENFDKLIFKLADTIGAAVGGSRAAVDSGYCDNAIQIGQTGKVVAPEIYLAVGISGAIQHIAGMKDSKVIAAINSDPDAPIFQISDYGLVADLFTAVPELTEKLKK
ncbi:electron transfer flavo protein-like protein subunit alpha [Glomus cerebriforme]|uniref:Probable electron transfer flavoprotein subunit alpha n=1 Tax=Glomus cerebriforme TaxID=658196 RepID=A0A397T609_9GLOM|nr:electron transfer flavo protein-like protein subunit alpha [Glomus cerebriforme]